MIFSWLSSSRTFLCSIVFCLVLAGSILAVEPDRALVNYVLREDFQGDGLGQFASYPPAQDIGYEPSITPTTELSETGGRALMRVWQPTENGPLRFGFIRQAEMFAATNSSLAFSYRLNVPSGGAKIELGIAGSDGCRYTATIDATVNSWTKTSAPLSKFVCGGKTLASGVGIEAFYLVANIGNADRDFIYRFVIDDVALSGAHAARFEIVTPMAQHFEPWPSDLSSKSYRTDETFTVEAKPSVPISTANITLKSFDGNAAASVRLYDDGTHGDKRANDSIWTNSAVRRFAETDARGVWYAELTGNTRDGKLVRSDLRFVVRSDRNSAHPRLYFDPAQRAALTARIKDPRLAKVWEYVLTTAKTSRSSGVLKNGGEVFERLDDAYLLPTLLGYFDVLNRARFRISYNAFVAYANGDAAARASAKEALLDASRWSRWEPPWFTAHGQHTYYPAGQLAADVALGYDLLYDDLTDAERSLVRKALINNSIIPTWKEYVVDNRAMANTSNWIAHTVGGALIAASAIVGDVRPEESGGKFDLYVNGLLTKIEAHLKASFLPDGSYGEGISYQEFDLETLAPMAVAVERAFGPDYFHQTNLKDSLGYAIYTATDPISGSLDMGDTHPPGGHGIPALVYRSNDPVVRWYYSRFERPSLQQFIFFDDSIAAKTPAEVKLPRSRVFRDKGNAVFRTGWSGPDEIAFLFRAGATFNHHHADQGSFLLTAFGEPLITEAGWSDYYKDPYYATYFTQAVGHNTVLVNGDPESQIIPDTSQFAALDEHPRITDALTSNFFDGVGSELSSAYNKKLSRYVRRIVFMKPNYFVIFDDLAANRTQASYDLLLHLPDGSRVTAHGLNAVYTGQKASVAIRSFAQVGTTMSVKEGKIPYPVFSTTTPKDTPPQPVYLDFGTRSKSINAQFVTAIVPSTDASKAQSLIDNIKEVRGAGASGINVSRGTEKDLILFRVGGDDTPIVYGDWSANAAVLALTEGNAAIEMFAVENGSRLTRNGKVYFASDTAISFAARYETSMIEVVCSADRSARVTFYVSAEVRGVTLDGKPLSDGDFTTSIENGVRTLSFSVTKGTHSAQINLR